MRFKEHFIDVVKDNLPELAYSPGCTIPVTSFSSLSKLSSWNDNSWYKVFAERFSLLVVVRP